MSSMIAASTPRPKAKTSWSCAACGSRLDSDLTHFPQSLALALALVAELSMTSEWYRILRFYNWYPLRFLTLPPFLGAAVSLGLHNLEMEAHESRRASLPKDGIRWLDSKSENSIQ